MADFTTGVIDLSIENVFDNITMGTGDTMTFSNSGTGGQTNKPIVVLGDITITGGTITLRNGQNLSAGTVTVGGITRDLDADDVVSGLRGSGGAGVNSGTDRVGGSGGNGGQISSLYNPTNGGGDNGSVYPLGGAGVAGSVPSGDGGYGSALGYYAAGGGGGGGQGTNGMATENVAFLSIGDISITGGTITGIGTSGTDGGDGGAGGSSGSGQGAGGGGGGGGAGGGGSAGNLYLYHVGTASEAFTTKTLTGGLAGTGGTGGAGGTNFGGDGGNGTNGTAGADGVVELISVTSAAIIETTLIKEIFAPSAVAQCSILSDGGSTITERGVVWNTSGTPTTADDSSVITGTTGTYSVPMIGLSEDTTYYARAYSINGAGTSYGNELTFKTIKSFIPYTLTAS